MLNGTPAQETSEHMAAAAFSGTGLYLLMTADALLVKGIGSFWHGSISTFRFMAFLAGLRRGISLFQRMMAILARKSVTRLAEMGFMVEQNLSGDTIKHNADGPLGRGTGKSHITDDTDNEQNNGRPKNELLFFLKSHKGIVLSVLILKWT